MNFNRAPLIHVGQVYLHEDLNEYLIVTRNNRGQVSFQGRGINGQSEDFSFIDRFPPVDPTDVEQSDLDFLVSLCDAGTIPTVGFVGE